MQSAKANAKLLKRLKDHRYKYIQYILSALMIPDNHIKHFRKKHEVTKRSQEATVLSIKEEWNTEENNCQTSKALL